MRKEKIYFIKNGKTVEKAKIKGRSTLLGLSDPFNGLYKL